MPSQTQNMGIRMGASGNPALYRGTIDALVRIAREEGVVGLYRWAQGAGWARERAAGGMSGSGKPSISFAQCWNPTLSALLHAQRLRAACRLPSLLTVADHPALPPSPAAAWGPPCWA